MKIAVAAILQESNNFSPVPTTYDDFNPVFGPAVLARHSGKLTEMGGFLDILSATPSIEIAPVCAAWAITANRLRRTDFARLKNDFAHHLSEANPDALLLAMHGAQTAVAEDDVEGSILTIARKILGPRKPIFLTLDLHANLTQRMVTLADAIVGYHTYPHIDMFETGQKAARLLLRTLSGELRPSIAYRNLPLIIPPENSQTHRGPMHALITAAQAVEASGLAEAISIFPVQPWLDIAEMGCSVVAVTNNRPKSAQRYADTFARRLWRGKNDFEITLTPVPEAIAAAS